MLVRVKNNDKDRIIEYLRTNVEECIYLFIDITTYNIDSEECKVWYIESMGQIEYVLMWYFNSYQLYSTIKNCIPKEIVEHIKNAPGQMISGRKDLIEQLSNQLAGYKTTYGYVYDLNRVVGKTAGESVQWGTAEDVDEIARLIQMDADIGAHYSFEVLKNQLKHRLETKTGRNCIIRENGQIIAHTATYAENSELAVISGTVVHPDWRNGDYFLRITTAIQKLLAEEGKKAYTFSVSPKMIRYHQRLHKQCAEYGKMELIKELEKNTRRQ